jgi:hypothetical protein
MATARLWGVSSQSCGTPLKFENNHLEDGTHEGMNLPRPPFFEKKLKLLLSMSFGPGRYDADDEEKGRAFPCGHLRWTERRNMAAFLELVTAGKVDAKRLAIKAS